MTSLLQREFPTLTQWFLDQDHHLDGEADDFLRHFAEVERWSRAAHALAKTGGLTQEQRACGLMIRSICIAMIETGRMIEKDGAPPDMTSRVIARAAGFAALNAVASQMNNDTPWRDLAAILIEEFRHGAKSAADILAEHNDMPGGADD